ncbi:MAG TPA: DUF1657 domain-containing protein [Bacillota bacterium]|nr:DUF1657 domain-containing protein [Bacillota bacterium]
MAISRIRTCYIDLKSAHAMIKKLTYQTYSEETKQVYEEARQDLQQIINDLRKEISDATIR